MPALQNPKHERQLITREQAKASNSTKFFMAAPCKRGHLAEQYVVNGKCAECQRLEMRDRYWRNPELMRQKSTEYAKIPENREKISARSKEYKKIKPTGFFQTRKREKEAGRPRPDVCDICSKPNQIKKPIYWDHCHDSGKFRGWLCHRCNTILGKVDDSPEMLRKMVDYLENTGPK